MAPGLGQLVLGLSGAGFPLTQLAIRRLGRRGAVITEGVEAGDQRQPDVLEHAPQAGHPLVPVAWTCIVPPTARSVVLVGRGHQCQAALETGYDAQVERRPVSQTSRTAFSGAVGQA
jgi:hypothetical protein